MIDFETWWNSSSADEFRRLNDDMDGRVVRPVWDAAIRATLSSQKATSAAPSPEATQPTQAEAPSEREGREMQEVADKLREAGYHSAANNTERTIADIKSGNMPRAVIGAALATHPEQAADREDSEGSWKALPDRLRGRGDWLKGRGRIKDAELMFDAATEIEGARAALARGEKA